MGSLTGMGKAPLQLIRRIQWHPRLTVAGAIDTKRLLPGTPGPLILMHERRKRSNWTHDEWLARLAELDSDRRLIDQYIRDEQEPGHKHQRGHAR